MGMKNHELVPVELIASIAKLKYEAPSACRSCCGALAWRCASVMILMRPFLFVLARRHGGSQRILSTLLRYKLIAHDQAKYNGYRLTYQGYDVLALRALFSRGKLTGVGFVAIANFW